MIKESSEYNYDIVRNSCNVYSEEEKNNKKSNIYDFSGKLITSVDSDVYLSSSYYVTYEGGKNNYYDYFNNFMFSLPLSGVRNYDDFITFGNKIYNCCGKVIIDNIDYFRTDLSYFTYYKNSNKTSRNIVFKN